MSLPPSITHEPSLLCVNSAYGVHPDRVGASQRYPFLSLPAVCCKLSTVNFQPHLFRTPNEVK